MTEKSHVESIITVNLIVLAFTISLYTSRYVQMTTGEGWLVGALAGVAVGGVSVITIQYAMICWDVHVH